MGRFLKKFTYLRLPPKESFYSSIDDGKRGKSDGHIFYAQCLHLKLVWKKFGFKIFRDFHNHYLKKDVLLLADVFEKFISTSLNNYNLDPCHYFSAPGLSWDAMLKMTKVELEKITDGDIHLFIEKGMRGVLVILIKGLAKQIINIVLIMIKINLKTLFFNLDLNNLYGDAISEYLPYGGFKWVEITNGSVNRVLNKSDNSLHGYFLEVDLEYPKELHDKHNDCPLAPEKIKIEDDMLSLYCLKIKNKHKIKTGDINKLARNLMSKNNYVLHYKNLQYYSSQGLILKKVHIILEFKQSDWMKHYIDLNTQKRKEATNEADKNLSKPLNDAVYGKTMENMRKRIKITTTTNEKDFLKYASRST